MVVYSIVNEYVNITLTANMDIDVCPRTDAVI